MVFLTDLAEHLRTVPDLRFIFYADDLVMFSENPTSIKTGLERLHEWCSINRLKVNTRKSKIMKFRKKGRLCRNDRGFVYGDTELEIVNSYEYLGVILQTTLTFTDHIMKRKAAAAAVIGSLKNLRLVSLDTAIRIFDLKVRPIACYALDSICSFLTCRQLAQLDRVKSLFLKKAIGVHKSASSTLVHEIAATATLTEDLKRNNYIISDNEWTAYKELRDEKKTEATWKYGSDGPAFQSDSWKGSLRKNRHVFTRATVHGFHHLLCCYQECYEPKDDCTCVLCHEENMTLYHVVECKANQSLQEFVSLLESLK